MIGYSVPRDCSLLNSQRLYYTALSQGHMGSPQCRFLRQVYIAPSLWYSTLKILETSTTPKSLNYNYKFCKTRQSIFKYKFENHPQIGKKNSSNRKIGKQNKKKTKQN